MSARRAARAELGLAVGSGAAHAGPRGRRAGLSLFFRLLGGTLVAVICALAVVALALPGMTENFLLAEKQKELTERGLQVQALVAGFLAGTASEDRVQVFLDALGGAAGAEVWVVDRSGTVVLESPAAGNDQGQGVGDAASGLACDPGTLGSAPGRPGFRGGRGVRGLRLQGEDAMCVLSGRAWSATGPRWPYADPVVSVAVPVLSPDGSQVLGGVYLNAPVSGVSRTADRLRAYLLLAGGVGLAAALGVAVALSRAIARPVRQMSRMATRVAEGDFAVRAPVGGGELGELGQALNTMAARLEASREESARLEEMRRDLVANVSHDLRSPITAIRGYVEPLLDGTLDSNPKTRRQYLETIRSEAEALGLLVTDLLELSRLDAGSVSLKVEPLDVGQLAREAAARYGARAAEAGIDLRCAVAEGLPPLLGDEARVARVMSNLLDNALKFTSAGGKVDLSVEARGDDGAREIVIAVKDTGQGIAPENLPYVWERFYKADKSRHRRGGRLPGRGGAPEGSGLGLAIVKEAVQAHGGRVEVESEPGRGSIFRVYFPVAGERA